ncbi:hypothetical protein GY45DRAFT_1375871 [Cubamyces sp. BRFM 1775]|nr:hypothetical protein GY45DRAFT_1375871 [Cubamyces sp. BRFM 1775]
MTAIRDRITVIDKRDIALFAQLFWKGRKGHSEVWWIHLLKAMQKAAQSTLAALHRLTIDDEVDVVSGRDRGAVRPSAVQLWALTQLQAVKAVQKVSLTVDQAQAPVAFPGLRELELSLETMPRVKARSTAGFMRLRDLVLGKSLEDINSFLAATCPPGLESVLISSKFQCTRYSPNRRAKDSIQPLSRSLPAYTRQFRLAMTCACDPDTEIHFEEPGELLEPLHRLTALCHVELVFAMNFHLPNDILCSLRDAWPGLRTFKVATLAKPKRPVHEERHNDARYSLGHACRMSISRHHLSEPTRPPAPPPPRSDRARPDLTGLPDPDAVPILGHALRAPTPASDGAELEDRMGKLMLVPRLGLQTGSVGARWRRAESLGGYTGDIPLLSPYPSRPCPRPTTVAEFWWVPCSASRCCPTVA